MKILRVWKVNSILNSVAHSFNGLTKYFFHLDELNRAVCWYLTCERYWEDGPIEQRAFPWGLVFVLVMVLSLGVCFCYYIIWILFEYLKAPKLNKFSHFNQPKNLFFPFSSDDHLSLQSAIGGQNPTHLSPTHHRLHATVAGSANYHHQQQQHIHPHIVPVGGQQQIPSTSGSQSVQGTYGDEFYVAPDFNDVGQSEHYIYVTYPPELKRRLLERYGREIYLTLLRKDMYD